MDRPPKTREPFGRVPSREERLRKADLRAVGPLAIMPAEKSFYYSLRRYYNAYTARKNKCQPD